MIRGCDWNSQTFMVENYQETNCTQELMANFWKIFVYSNVFAKENRYERNTFWTWNHLEYENNIALLGQILQ